MADMLIVIYLAGWLPVSFATYAAGRRLTHRQSPAKQPMMVMVSAAAGAAWPLLVVGLIEMSSVMMLTKMPSRSRQSVGIFA